MTKPSNDQAEIKFFHGWAYQSESWRDWQTAVGSSSNVVEFFDRGYFGKPHAVAPFNVGEQAKVVIAHSLGFHLIPSTLLQKADFLVLIASFKHFHDFNGDLHISHATTRAMRNRLQKNAPKVLNDFYKQSGDGRNLPEEEMPDPEQLWQDLQLLDRSRLNATESIGSTKTLILHGEKDLIVNPLQAKALKEALPDASLCLHPEANHALPFTEVDWCVERLSEFCPSIFERQKIKVTGGAR